MYDVLYVFNDDESLHKAIKKFQARLQPIQIDAIFVRSRNKRAVRQRSHSPAPDSRCQAVAK